MDCHTPGSSVLHCLQEFAQIHVHWVSVAIKASHRLLPPPFTFSLSRVFSNESDLLIRWPNYWSFSFSISSFNEYSGLISFRIDWLDLLAVQGKSVFIYLLFSSCVWMQYVQVQYSIIWPPDAKNWFIWKDPDAGKDWRQEEKGTAEDEMVGWHHHCHGYWFEQAPGVGDRQGILACCSPWGHEESDTTERLNWMKYRCGCSSLF